MNPYTAPKVFQCGAWTWSLFQGFWQFRACADEASNYGIEIE